MFCQNCGYEADTNIKFDPSLSMYECEQCNGWMYKSHDLIKLDEIYSKKYYSGHEYLNYEMGAEVYKSNFVRKLTKIKRSASVDLNKEWRILEIGCATGVFLQILKENGFDKLLGLEVSEYAREVAKNKGFKILNPLDETSIAKIKDFRPNIIIAWDVWEHLEESAITIEKIFEISDSEVIMALSTVDVSGVIPKIRKTSWRQFHPPSHINYPSRKSFQYFFKKNGFDIILLESFGYSRPLADYLAVFLGPMKKVLCKFPILFKIPLYLNLGDIQFVIAKKRN